MALLLFGVASAAASAPGVALTDALPALLFAVPGGAILGIALGKLNIHIAPAFAGTWSAIIVQFVMTFGAWILAERLHLSPIISVVANGMTVARKMDWVDSARYRRTTSGC